MEERLKIKLSEDEAQILIEMILDDLESIGHFTLLLDTIKDEPIPTGVFITFAQRFALNLAMGKTSIAKMLISKTKGARPSEVSLKMIAKWERIEDEIIKKGVNNE